MSRTRIDRDAELPSSLVCEHAVLSAIMTYGGSMGSDLQPPWTPGELAQIVSPEDFYHPENAALYGWLLLRYQSGQSFDFVSTVEQIMQEPDPQRYGGPTRINRIFGWDYSDLEVVTYCHIIRDTAAKRRLLRVLADGHSKLLHGASVQEVRGTVEEAVSSRDLLATTAVEDIGDLVTTVWTGLLSEASGGSPSYYSTGIVEIDDMEEAVGVSLKGVTLVIARSGMGKTTLANTLAVQMARHGRRVLVCPTETSKKRRTADMLFSMAGVNSQLWAKRCKQRTEWGRAFPSVYQHEIDTMSDMLQRASHQLAELPIKVCETGWTVERLCSEIRRRHRQGEVDVVMIDYLQDLTPSRAVGGSRMEQVAHASKTIKDLQVELQVPIVLFAQAKHTDETPKARSANEWLIPQMGDVQWASQSYQDAEEVWALYRHDYYATRHEDPALMLPGIPGHLTIAYRKRRDGQAAIIHVPCDMSTKWIGSRQ